MLSLPDHWVWDSWYVTDDDGRHHVFFLRASRALHDPERRHHRASIGHAVSDDLHSWRLAADALVAADEPAWDDLATWTGSVVRAPDGRWFMFYTGVSRTDGGRVQRIGLAVSQDLHTWHRYGGKPLVEADRTWYERLDPSGPAEGDWPEEAWRDPWVFPDPAGDGWHMLITARAGGGTVGGRGVIGHARSDDLMSWEVRPPLTEPAGFGHLEVPQVAVVDGRPLLLFCTNAVERPDATANDRIWTVSGTSVTGPWDISAARPVPCPHVYAPRLVQDVSGAWQLIGFADERDGTFAGELIDPIPVRHSAARGLYPVLSGMGTSATVAE
ncbi:glycoside hydrolase family 68 protein [Streptomyces sp. S.PB5]|uniref:glycoside hydrolase family 68 protein n=1 Tax=Streptomyces sp. S.PB5 TaxID=3020844 RepID=UPI0025B174E5|nr:glycoside hydrolase family 68 protein [Streptomyces sp. S.PB5]MDN3029308.1 glycoside hydrolase family 68 protein [Streptomyces sp. S.PB5]